MTVTEIIPLGVGSAVPVAGRGFSCVALRRPESVILFDCGEGTQLRLLNTDIKLSRIQLILVTHLHGDHFFGLMGLLATMSLLHRQTTLEVVGPAGIRELVRSMPGLGEGEMTYEVSFTELKGQDRRIPVVKCDEYQIVAGRLDHAVPTFGYRYEERDRPGALDAVRARELGVTKPQDFGRLKSGETVRLGDGSMVEPVEVLGEGTPGGVFTYITDTKPCAAAVDLAAGADILYHEATFAENLADRADATGHSTAAQAARIARDARASRLLLSHFSARYRRFNQLIEEAQAIFPESAAAEELARYVLQPALELSGHE